VNSAVTTSCTYNYTLYFANGTLYSASSLLSIGSSTGILTSAINSQFSFSLKIVVSTVELTTPLTSTTSSFTVSVINCVSPPIISANIQSSYTYNL
jgi:hypothetical protein